MVNIQNEQYVNFQISESYQFMLTFQNLSIEKYSAGKTAMPHCNLEQKY